MGRWLLLLALLACLTPPIAAQDVGALEEQAEQAFASDDLVQAALLYHQAALAAQQNADRARLLMAAGWTEFLADQIEISRSSLAQALAVDPAYRFEPDNYSEGFVALFYEAQKRAAEQRENEFNLALRQGQEALKQNRAEQAKTEFLRALERKKDHPRALYHLGLAQMQLGQRDEAVALFSKIIALESLQPNSIPSDLRSLSRINLGRLQIELQTYEEAERLLEEAVRLDLGSQSAWTNLGVARRRQGKTAAAAEAFRKAHELAPEDPSAINNLALAYIDNKEWILAVGLLRPATLKFPQNASLWLNLGLSQEGMGNENGAVQSFERAIENDLDNQQGFAATAALRLAMFHHHQRNWVACRQQAQRALGWNPSSVHAWVFLGLAEQGLSDLPAARRSLEKARELEPRSADIQNSLGSLYFEMGLLDLAEQAYQQALSLKPDFEVAKKNLEGLRSSRGQMGPKGGKNAPAPLPELATGAAPPGAKTATPVATNPPSAGLRFSSIDYSSLGLSGVMVENVSPGSAAARAGIQANDLLLKVDGQSIANQEQFQALMRELQGKTVSIDLLRANRPIAIRFTVP